MNINGSNCNVYTKSEVDAKVAGGVGLLLKGNDTDGVVENINAEINSTPNGFAKMFKSNYNGSYQMQTIFTVKLDTSRTFSLMFPKDSNVFRFQTTFLKIVMYSDFKPHLMELGILYQELLAHHKLSLMKLRTLERLMSTQLETQYLQQVECASMIE